MEKAIRGRTGLLKAQDVGQLDGDLLVPVVKELADHETVEKLAVLECVSRDVVHVGLVVVKVLVGGTATHHPALVVEVRASTLEVSPESERK